MQNINNIRQEVRRTLCSPWFWCLMVIMFIIGFVGKDYFLKTKPHRWVVLQDEAQALYDAGKYVEATPLMEESVCILRSEFPEGSGHLAQGLCNLGLLYRSQDRISESRAALEESISIHTAVFGPQDLKIVTPLRYLSQIHWMRGDLDNARECVERAYRIVKAKSPDNSELLESLSTQKRNLESETDP